MSLDKEHTHVLSAIIPQIETMRELMGEMGRRLAASQSSEQRLSAACERYSEVRCAYIDAIPIACPGILADGIACMACGIRAALAEEKDDGKG